MISFWATAPIGAQLVGFRPFAGFIHRILTVFKSPYWPRRSGSSRRMISLGNGRLIDFMECKFRRTGQEGKESFERLYSLFGRVIPIGTFREPSESRHRHNCERGGHITYLVARLLHINCQKSMMHFLKDCVWRSFCLGKDIPDWRRNRPRI
jgi:hypothetical protein